MGVPAFVNCFRPELAPLASRCVASIIAQTNPQIWLLACMWMLIAFRIVMGRMKVPRQTQG